MHPDPYPNWGGPSKNIINSPFVNSSILEKPDSDLIRSPGFHPVLLACHIFCAFHSLLLRCSCAPRGGHLCAER